MTRRTLALAAIAAASSIVACNPLTSPYKPAPVKPTHAPAPAPTPWPTMTCLSATCHVLNGH